MHRPTSIKVAGIFLMAVCFLWVGDSILVTYILLHRGLPPTLQNPRFTRLLVNWGIVLAVSFWGIATSIGILRLRGWARISIIALSVVVAYHCLGLVFASPFVRSQGFPVGVRTFMLGLVLAYFGCGGLAVLVIVVFSSDRMDRVFLFAIAGQSATEKAEPAAATVAGSRALLDFQRPLSTLVIGAWLLFAGPLELYQGLFHYLVITIPLPSEPFGFLLPPRAQATYLVLMAAAAVGLGLGLLKGDYYWARRGTIVFCIFSIVSEFTTVLRPEYIARASEGLSGNTNIIHTQVALWSLASWSVVPPAVALYFLATRRFSLPEPSHEP